jgi:caspase domain-containing protein
MSLSENDNNNELNEKPSIHALLIGIDYYLPNTIPGAPIYKSLNGCVKDIDNVETFLKSKIGVSDKNIIKLISSFRNKTDKEKNVLGNGTIDKSENLPTYDNIVAKFNEIVESSKKGDYVYFHYSGHGGRVPTLIPKLKGANGLDETIVPMDIGDQNARYVRDIEMATIINRMVSKELLVTLVLDSCHSGGITRGNGGATVRGTDLVDTSPRPNTSFVATVEELSANWKNMTGRDETSNPLQTRNVVSFANGWLPQPKGYVLLAACRPSELAYEFAFEGDEKNGALTFFLLKSLSNIDKKMTFKVLHDQIVAKIHSKFPQQTPMLEGEGDRIIFGSLTVDKPYAVNVMDTDETKGVLLNTGQAQGVRKGALFAIYPSGFSDYNQKDERLAIAEVVERGATNSWARIKENYNKGVISQGSQAVLIDPVSIELIKKVYLVDLFDDNGNNNNSNNLDMNKRKLKLEELKNVIEQEGKGFIELSTIGSINKSDFQINVDEKGYYEIWDPAGNEIPNLNPKLNAFENNSSSLLVKRLVHLVKYYNIQQLDNYDKHSDIKGKLLVDLFAVRSDFESGDKPDLQNLETEGNVKKTKVGQKLLLRLSNTFSRDSGRVLNVTVLDLQPDWGITQVYPNNGYYIPLDPEQEELLPLSVDLPSSYKQGKDIIKVFAVLDQTNFHWLELPPLDQPISKSITRGEGPKDSLEQLMSTMNGDTAKTRNIMISPNASKEWNCISLELDITR